MDVETYLEHASTRRRYQGIFLLQVAMNILGWEATVVAETGALQVGGSILIDLDILVWNAEFNP